MNRLVAEDESFRQQSVETSVFRELRTGVAEGVTPILLLGLPGSGKSCFLRALSYDWGDTGQPVVFIRLYSIGKVDDLVNALRTALALERPRPNAVKSKTDQWHA
jgi:predicted AAA+ superfamily ATPase